MVYQQASDGTYTYFLEDGTEVSSQADAVVTITSGQTRTFTNLEPGTYTVYELGTTNYGTATLSGYYLTATGSGPVSVTSGSTASATLRNSYTPPNTTTYYGGLRVYKTVSSSDSNDLTKEFTFTIKLSDTSISGTYGNITFSSGTATVKLKNGESATATGLPTGVSYTVTETEANSNGFTTTSTGTTGTISSSTVSTAHFTNTKGTTSKKTQVSLTANKRLTGRSLAAGEFSFQLKDESGNVLQTKTNGADGTVNFDPIEYTTTGNHHYTISEVTGNVANVAYDTHVAGVNVKVTEDSSGNLVAQATYDTAAPNTFNNTYTPPSGQVSTPTATTVTTTTTPATTTVVRQATPTTGDVTWTGIVPALMAVGAAGIGGGLYRRRRKED